MGRHNASRSSRAQWTPQPELLESLTSGITSGIQPGDPFEPETARCESSPIVDLASRRGRHQAIEHDAVDHDAVDLVAVDLDAVDHHAVDHDAVARRGIEFTSAFEHTAPIEHIVPPAPSTAEITPELTADIMGRISAAELLARHNPNRPTGRSRAGKRALAKRPLWRRSPVIPAVAATLAVWAVGDGLHLLGGQGAGSAPSRAASASSDLSALATGSLLSASQERVSRSSRTSGDSGDNAFASALPLPLPMRKNLPAVKIGQTVLGDWIRPSSGGESSCFCMRWGVMHEGIDLAAPLGSPIVAVGDGVVIAAGPAEGFGHWIVIQHSNGDVSIYGHMYTVLVSVGEHVVAGQHIADVGSDGEATGPHLHFGVREGGMNGPYIDPVPWLYARGIDVGPYNPSA